MDRYSNPAKAGRMRCIELAISAGARTPRDVIAGATDIARFVEGVPASYDIRKGDRFDQAVGLLTGGRWSRAEANTLIQLIEQGAATLP